MCDIEILAPDLLIIQVFPAHHSVCHYTDHIYWHVVKLVALTMAWGQSIKTFDSSLLVKKDTKYSVAEFLYEANSLSHS